MPSGGNFVLQVVSQADRVLVRLEELPEVCLLSLLMLCSVTSSCYYYYSYYCIRMKDS